MSERDEVVEKARAWWPIWWKKNFPGCIMFEPSPNTMLFATDFHLSQVEELRRERDAIEKVLTDHSRDYGNPAKEIEKLFTEVAGWQDKTLAAEAESSRLKLALRGLLEKIDAISNVDDGCLYINGRTAEEFKEPIAEARGLVERGGSGERVSR